jgi:hypothetical protein
MIIINYLIYGEEPFHIQSIYFIKPIHLIYYTILNLVGPTEPSAKGLRTGVENSIEFASS